MLPGLVSMGSTAAGLVIGDNLLGRPFELWTRTVDKENEPTVRAAGYAGNQRLPNSTASPDGIIKAFKAGLLHADIAASELMYSGVFPLESMITRLENPTVQNRIRNTDLSPSARATYSRFWENMAVLQQSRPTPDTVAKLVNQGRTTNEQARALRYAQYADWEAYRAAVEASYQVPNEGDLRQLNRWGELSDADYKVWMRRAGWTSDASRQVFDSISNLPTLGELLLSSYRGELNEGEETSFRKGIGYVNNRVWDLVKKANRPYPTPSDLVLFAVREVWDTDARRRLGYDQEFPEPFRYWMSKQGMDWGERFTGADGRQYPSVNWPLAYWIAHWRTMSPTEAYRAVHLLRPDRLWRYQDIAPGVTPFQVADLRAVLKVADYPQPIRNWLAAIAFNPLRLTDIRASYQEGLRNRQWVVDQLLDRGYVRDDANSVADLWGQRNRIDRRRLIRNQIANSTRALIREILGGYYDGLVPRADAIQRLQDVGFTAGNAGRMLDVEDSRLLRKWIRTFLASMRRHYLSGALNQGDLLAGLRAARISDARALQYVRQWTSELTTERKTLSTSQIAQAVAAGLLTPAMALVRLGNLGWPAPDAALLLAKAEQQLALTRSRVAVMATREARARASQLRQAQSQAQAAVRSAQSQLRSIYPRATLQRQYCLGIRKAPTIRGILASQGYNKDAIDGLLLQWTMECEASPPNPDKRVGSVIAYNKRQTPLSMLKDWYQNGIITEQWARQRLGAIGLERGTIEATIRLWQSTLGKKSGPAPEGSPSPTELANANPAP